MKSDHLLPALSPSNVNFILNHCSHLRFCHSGDEMVMQSEYEAKLIIRVYDKLNPILMSTKGMMAYSIDSQSFFTLKHRVGRGCFP